MVYCVKALSRMLICTGPPLNAMHYNQILCVDSDILFLPLLLSMPGKYAFFLSADLLKTFSQVLLGIPSDFQTVWIQIRPDIRSGLMSGLIWVQTLCKCYQQTTKAHKELNRSDLMFDKTDHLII